MNPKINTELQPRSIDLKELLNPNVTPEMGFQSYAAFGVTEGLDEATSKLEKEKREAEKRAFIAGEIVNPHTDYPALDEQALESGIHNLNGILDVANGLQEGVREAVWDSASYRMAEMFYLQACSKFNREFSSLISEQRLSRAQQIQALNEQLYGKPEQITVDMIRGEIWSQVESKEFVGVGKQIYDELKNGAELQIAGDTVELGPLVNPGVSGLPQIPKDLLDYLNQKLRTENPVITDIVYGYWSDIVLARPEGEQAFTPQDMFKIFLWVHRRYDIEDQSGVQVIMDPGATALAWETPKMAVMIAGSRANINDPKVLFGKIIHEYLVHGGRTIFGVNSELPVLGTGLYTDAEQGEVSDYLSFEEGLATICEQAVTGGSEGWSPKTMEKTLAITLAYEGKDFRQVFETLWRTRVLMLVKSGQEPTQTMIDAAKKNSYLSTFRVFRGTPTDMPRVSDDGIPIVLTFNKDLAYLDGRLRVIDFWNRFKDNPRVLDLIFKGKFDPTNHRQLELAEKYL